MNFYVYILYSEKLGKFYIGTTDSLEQRLEEHNTVKYAETFTSRGIPWQLYFQIVCDFSEQAYKIEKHIKAMHSSQYIKNLKIYPEMVERLKLKCK